MLVVAFDQATVTTGYSVFLNGELIKYGHFNFDGEILERMSLTIEKMIKITDKYLEEYPNQPFKVVIEDVQLQRNALTFKQLSQLQGAVLVAFLDKYHKTPDVYSASVWKSFNGIKGKNRTEQKQNAQKLARQLFKIRPTQDEADAVLLGRYAASNFISFDDSPSLRR